MQTSASIKKRVAVFLILVVLILKNKCLIIRVKILQALLKTADQLSLI